MKLPVLALSAILMINASAGATSGEVYENNSHNQADTIKVLNDAREIIISREGNKTVLNALIPSANEENAYEQYTYTSVTDSPNYEKILNNNELLFRLSFLKEKDEETSVKQKFRKKHYVTGLKYIYWGWNFNYNNKAGIKNSYEVGIADLIGIDWRTSRKTTLGVGLGFGFNRVTTRDHQLFAMPDETLTVIQAPDDAVPEFARLDSWRFHVPLMFSQKLSHSFGFALATIINFNTYTTATNRYNIDKTRYTETIKGINQRLLTVDLMATLGFVNAVGVYAKWSPITAIEPQYGPSYRNFSIGLNINF